MIRKSVRKSVSGKRLLAVASASAVAMLVRPSGASAANGDSYSWTGVTSGIWGVQTNWNDLTTPATNSGPQSGDTNDNLTFTGSTHTASTNEGTAPNGTTASTLLTQVNSITFDSNAAAFTLAGQTAATALSIGGTGGLGAITNNSSTNQTISELLAITPGDTVTFANNTSATTLGLSNTGVIGVGSAASTSTLSLAGAGNISITSGLSFASGSGLYINSSGSAVNTFARPITLGAANTLTFAGGTNSVVGALVGGDANSYVNVTGGTTYLVGTNTLTGTVSVAGGTLAIGNTASNAGALPATATVYLGNNGVLELNEITNNDVAGNVTIQGSTNSAPSIVAGSIAEGGWNPIYVGTSTSALTMNNNLTIIADNSESPLGANVFYLHSSMNGASLGSSTITFQGNSSNSNLIIDSGANSGLFTGTLSIVSGAAWLANYENSTSHVIINNGAILTLANRINSGLAMSGNITLNGGGGINIGYDGGYAGLVTGVISETTPSALTVNQTYFTGPSNNSIPANGQLLTGVNTGAPILSLASSNTYTGGTSYIGFNLASDTDSTHAGGMQLTGVNALGTDSTNTATPTAGTGGVLHIYTPASAVGYYSNASINTTGLFVSTNPAHDGQIQVNANQTIRGLDNSSASGDQGSITGKSSSQLILASQAGDHFTFSGQVGGTQGGLSGTSLGVQITGSGTQALLGITSAYIGGTTISGTATLQISDDRNLGAIAGKILLDGGTLETNTGVSYGLGTSSGAVVATSSFTSPTSTGSGVLPKVFGIGQAASVSLVSGGANYTNTPTVSVFGNIDAYTTEVAVTATYNSGTSTVSGLTLTNPGANLTEVPTLGLQSAEASVHTNAVGVIDTMSLTGVGQLSSGFGVASPTLSVGTAVLSATVTDPTIANAVSLTGNGGTLKVDGGSTLAMTNTLSGGTAGSTLSVTGGGALSLTGSLTYAGTTDVEGATVSLIGSSALTNNSNIIVGNVSNAGTNSVLDITGISGSTYTVNSQTLSGHGTIVTGGNTLAIANGATLQPGGTPGTLAVTGSLNVAGGSNLIYDMAGTGSSTAISNLLTFGGTSLSPVTLTVSNLAAGTYDLFSYGSYSGDTDGGSGIITNDFDLIGNSAGTAVITETGTGAGDIVLSVPEPASLSFLAIGALGLLGRRRRKSRKPDASQEAQA